MKNFLFVYRFVAGREQPSPEEMQENMNRWMNWLGSIAAQDKLVDQGHSLQQTGKVVKADGIITDGPYAEIKELIGGYSVVKTETIEEAAELAKGCPIFLGGGNVEVRELNMM